MFAFQLIRPSLAPLHPLCLCLSTCVLRTHISSSIIQWLLLLPRTEHWTTSCLWPASSGGGHVRRVSNFSLIIIDGTSNHSIPAQRNDHHNLASEMPGDSISKLSASFGLHGSNYSAIINRNKRPVCSPIPNYNSCSFPTSALVTCPHTGHLTPGTTQRWSGRARFDCSSLLDIPWLSVLRWQITDNRVGSCFIEHV